MLFEWIILIATLATGIATLLIWLNKKKSNDYLPNSALEFFGSLFSVLLLVFVLRSFVIEPFRIPSSSMAPNLLDGDFIFVNKFRCCFYSYSWDPRNII